MIGLRPSYNYKGNHIITLGVTQAHNGERGEPHNSKLRATKIRLCHNTVVIDGKNMPPALTRVKKYQPLDDGCILLDAEVTWDGNYHLPDSFTIKAWDDEAYFGTYMRRQILWCGSYFIDVFSVKSDNRRRKEWVLHTDGELTNPSKEAKPMSPFTEGAQAKLHSLTYRKGEGAELQRYRCDGVFLDCHFLADGFTVIEGKGPNNPSVSDICYLLLRSEEPSPIYACVIEAHEGNSVIESVNIEKRGDEIAVTVKEISGKLKKFIPIFD